MFAPRVHPTIVLLVVGAITTVGACASTLALGTVTARGFDHASFPYRVMSGPGGAIMPGDWRLDNFHLANGAYKPKTTSEYRSRYELDHDDDGRADDTVRASRYDLRFINRRYSGEIWLRTIPLGAATAELELPVVLRRYVEGIANNGFTVTQISTPMGQVSVAVAERRFAARILDYAPVTVHGVEALVATIEVANVDQLQLDPNARGERARLVFVRAPFTLDRPRNGGEVARYRVLFVAGYVASPTDYERGLVDFEGLVARVVFEQAPGHVSPGVVQTGAATVLVQPPGAPGPTPVPGWDVPAAPPPDAATMQPTPPVEPAPTAEQPTVGAVPPTP